MHQIRRGKDHVDYWRGRLVKRAYAGSRNKGIVSGWQVQVTHSKIRKWFNTHTNNKSEAATIARDFYLSVKSQGWEATLDKYRPNEKTPIKSPTIGEYFKAIDEYSTLSRRTLDCYKRKFRTLVVECLDLPRYDRKLDHPIGSKNEWLKTIEAVKLSRLTAEKVHRWKRIRIDSCKGDPLQIRRAKITVNTIIRNAKALFGPKILKNLPFEIPQPLWFDGVDFEKAGKIRYISRIDVDYLVAKAREELKSGDHSQQQQYKIFILALGAGLRRDEIDKLKWADIDFKTHRLFVLTSEDGAVKSIDSESDVDIHESLSKELKYFHQTTFGRYVIESHCLPNPQAKQAYYRCKTHFRKLGEWLRKHGVQSHRPIHELKEFGSLICASGAFSLQAASCAIQIFELHETIIWTKKRELLSI